MKEKNEQSTKHESMVIKLQREFEEREKASQLEWKQKLETEVAKWKSSFLNAEATVEKIETEMHEIELRAQTKYEKLKSVKVKRHLKQKIQETILGFFVFAVVVYYAVSK